MLTSAEHINTLVALAGGGALIAVIGFMDDHGHIAARWRLLGHFIAAAWMLGWLGGLPPLLLFGWTLDGSEIVFHTKAGRIKAIRADGSENERTISDPIPGLRRGSP